METGATLLSYLKLGSGTLTGALPGTSGAFTTLIVGGESVGTTNAVNQHSERVT